MKSSYHWVWRAILNILKRARSEIYFVNSILRFSCIAYLFNFKGMEPKGFRCPMPCENANNATYADIPEEWMFPYDSETEEYDYCNPYKFDESMINKPCQNDSFIMEEEKFDIENCQSK